MSKKNSGSNLEAFDMQLTPFNYGRLWGNEKYSLQNMVLKMVDFPATVDHAVDKTFSIYYDRAINEWHAAQRLIKSTQNADAFFSGTTDEDFLKFASKLFALLSNQKQFHARYKELYGTVEGYDDKHEKGSWDTAASEIESLPLTGALMIRMTNVSSGYPCECLIGVIQKSKQRRYSGNSAPFIKYPRSERGMDVFGRPILVDGYDPYAHSRYRDPYEEEGR